MLHLFKSNLRTLYAYAFYVCFKSFIFVPNRFGRECLTQPRATKVTILMETPSTAQPHPRCIQMILDVPQCTRQVCNMTTRILSVVKVLPGQSPLVRSISTWVIPKKTTLIYLPVRPIVVDRVVALDGSLPAKESPRLPHRHQNVSFRKAGLFEEGRISDKFFQYLFFTTATPLYHWLLKKIGRFRVKNMALVELNWFNEGAEIFRWLNIIRCLFRKFNFGC